MTAIEWTDRTWNPTTGCSVVSPGCANCYAETLSLRFGWSKKPWTPQNAAENVVLHPERLSKPLTWRQPSLVFVNSMSDLFHEQIPFEYIDRVFATMTLAYKHTFQVLTKRPERMREYMETGRPHLRIAGRAFEQNPYSATASDLHAGRAWPLPNVWLGTSIENARHAFRADILRETPAAVRFISAEPLLGSIFTMEAPGADVLHGIDWIIAGGESGNGARPMDAEWVREIRDACRVFGVAFFFKQWGGRTPKSNGRILDGRVWSEYPGSRAREPEAASPTKSADS